MTLFFIMLSINRLNSLTPRTEKEPPIDTLCCRLSRCLKIDLFNAFKFNVAQRCDAAVSRTRVRAITNILPVARADFFFVITVVASTKVAFPAIPQSTHSLIHYIPSTPIATRHEHTKQKSMSPIILLTSSSSHQYYNPAI